MRVLITGNLGYVGSVVVEHLAACTTAMDLVGLDTGFYAHRLSGAGPVAERWLDRQVFRDIRNVKERDLEGFDAIVHLAALSNDPMGKQFATLTGEINDTASERIVQYGKRLGIKKFVFASSCSMYGSSGRAARLESDSLEPLTAYAQSKVSLEATLRRHADADFVVTSLRFATACGVSPRLRLDLVVNDFVATALAQKQVVLLSDGTPWRPLIDVSDMARAVEWALLRPGADGGDFLAVNVGSEQNNVQIRDLAQMVCDRVDGTELVVSNEPPEDRRSYSVNFSLFQGLAPNHQPQMSVRDSIDCLVHHLEGRVALGEEWSRDGAYSRLHELRRQQENMSLDEELYWRSPYPAFSTNSA